MARCGPLGRLLGVAAAVALAGCGAQPDREMQSDRTGGPLPIASGTASRESADIPPPPAMIVPDSAEGRVLAKAVSAIEARYGVPGRPCLMRDWSSPDLSPAEFRRQREIQSDSHWLNRYVREKYPTRLLYSGLDIRHSRYLHVIALTGNEPIPALRLRDRAADVPVEIRYGAPWSLAEVMRRREAGNSVARHLLPTLNGEGFLDDPDGGAVSLDVYSPDGKVDADILKHCETLRNAYRLPVLISFHAGRIALD